MPSGGRRPGAGAPKGNFNAVRSGNRSNRMLLVYLGLVNHPDTKALARDLLQKGFLVPPRYKFNGDIRGVVSYLYRRWFDRPESEQSHSINNNQPATLATASDESEMAMARTLIVAQEKITREQAIIKAGHAAGVATEDEVR